MEQNWIKIFTSSNFFRSEMVKQMLIENQVEAVVLNKQDSSYTNFGSVEVYIHRDDFSHAVELMVLNKINI